MNRSEIDRAHIEYLAKQEERRIPIKGVAGKIINGTFRGIVAVFGFAVRLIWGFIKAFAILLYAVIKFCFGFFGV